jgi:hypothetical protein
MFVYLHITYVFLVLFEGERNRKWAKYYSITIFPDAISTVLKKSRSTLYSVLRSMKHGRTAGTQHTHTKPP